MSREHGFLQAILEDPEDDAPRLVLADWLEENGQAERAEFIRLQVELAGLPPDADTRTTRDRERELHARHARDWCAALGLEPGQCEFRRGLVEGVEVPAAWFLGHAEELFSEAPVRRVRFLHATDALGELTACPWLARLHTLDLSGNAVRDGGVAILGASEHLGQLLALDLGGCEVHEEGAAALAGATGLVGLRRLRLAGTGIRASGLQAILQSPTLAQVRDLDVRGNHQCWVVPRDVQLHGAPEEPWWTLTEANVRNEGVILLAESPEAARLERLDLGLNLIDESGWDALVNSPHLAGVQVLKLFESDHVYASEPPAGMAPPSVAYTVNEAISDILCESIPGASPPFIPRFPGDPRFTAPPCTIDRGVVERLRRRFGGRVRFDPPAERYGAHFQGTRDDWYGYRAVLELT